MQFQKIVTKASLTLIMLFAIESSICASELPKTTPTRPVLQCLQYEPATVSLNGQVVRGTFANASGKKEIVWMLKLNSPICIESDGAAGINQKAENITRLQLVLLPNDYKRYQKYLTKNVLASGTLFYGHTQHHFTVVLLSVTRIQLKS